MKIQIRVLLLLLLFKQPAGPEFQGGTVLFVYYSPDEVTFAADSRLVQYHSTGSQLTVVGQNDEECKVSAFGNNFVFTMAGLANITFHGQQNTHDIARAIWQSESAHEANAEKLVKTVSDKWVAAMREIYERPSVARYQTRKNGPVIANAFFAATDQTGRLAVHAVDLAVDLRLFQSQGIVRVNAANEGDMDLSGGPSAAGKAEIITELRAGTTPRAKKFKEEFRSQTLNMTPSQRRAAYATKLIELSVLFNSDGSVGLPVDVLQLRRRTGVQWVRRKRNCPAL